MERVATPKPRRLFVRGDGIIALGHQVVGKQHTLSTLFSRIWNEHQVAKKKDGRTLIYVDRHLTNEVASTVAFEGLGDVGYGVRRPDLTIAVMDHDVPTGNRTVPVSDPAASNQMALLAKNASRFRIQLFDYRSPFQGISHVIAPELGVALPGITLACGDSHASTNGALGALAIPIGTSETEHVLATQTIWLRRPKEMKIVLKGDLPFGVTAKDVALWVVRHLGTGGGIGFAIEYKGDAVKAMTVEQRMTLANMSVETGARFAIIEPDDKVYDYVRDTWYGPSGDDWDRAMERWRTLRSSPKAKYDSSHEFALGDLEPQVTWGTNPSMAVGITERVPRPDEFPTERGRIAAERALHYMGLEANTRIADVKIDRVFIGSCTNGRLSDLLEAAQVARGKHVSGAVRAMIVPGSQRVKKRAEDMGLDRIFTNAGFEWRNSGCSLCIALNEDRLSAGERCASTSNRNFENRQGPGGRTHLVSPMMAAAAAISGSFVDVRRVEISRVEELGLESER